MEHMGIGPSPKSEPLDPCMVCSPIDSLDFLWYISYHSITSKLQVHHDELCVDFITPFYVAETNENWKRPGCLGYTGDYTAVYIHMYIYIYV